MKDFFGFLKVTAVVPRLYLGDIDKNVETIKKYVSDSRYDGDVVLFPELCLTGYTCGDLFYNESFIEKVKVALGVFHHMASTDKTLFVVGAPLKINGKLYNCAIVFLNNKIVGIVPKINLPNYREYYEKRWFTSGADLDVSEISLFGYSIPCGTDLLFKVSDKCTFGIEICEDLWVPSPPSSDMALAGANLILNPSASVELVGKSDYRKQLVSNQSARCMSTYVYCSSGVGESTSDTVFGGDAIIAENGRILKQSSLFCMKDQSITAVVDCEKLMNIRNMEATFGNSNKKYRVVRTSHSSDLGVGDWPMRNKIMFFKDYLSVDDSPFIPKGNMDLYNRCEEILSIQSVGLARRIESAKADKTVIGVSGGLDSTLALLVCEKAWGLLGKNPSDHIIAVTMPTDCTSDQTFSNANRLCKAMFLDIKTINVNDLFTLNLSAIGHDSSPDLVYQNAQARCRTTVLMNLANQYNGLVVGTGDLSEIAIGWCTYNGDHMSMYNVNCGVPKTLIKFLIEHVAKVCNSDRTALKEVLLDVVRTPISPELLPLKDGRIVHKTEDIVGNYKLIDFFIYHFIKYGASPKKIVFLAAIAFGEQDENYLIKSWNNFITRFIRNQFKRNCQPDGPKVGTIALSPRGDWRMPSDMNLGDFLLQEKTAL